MSEGASSLKRLKVAELRERCVKYGVDSKGTKPVLINRILGHLGLACDDSEITILEDSSLASASQTASFSESQLEKEQDNKEGSENLAEEFHEETEEPPLPCISIGNTPQISQEFNSLAVLEKNKSSSEDERWGSDNPLELHFRPLESKNDSVELDFVHEDDTLHSEASPKHIEPAPASIASIEPGNTDSIGKKSNDSSNSLLHLKEPKTDGSKTLIPTKSFKDTSKVEKEDGDHYAIEYKENIVHLDPYVCDLHFVMVDDTLLTGSNLRKNELYHFWCGVKATYGITKGKAYFTIKILENLELDTGDQLRSSNLHGFRVGFSTKSSGLHLGDMGSCGYDSSGAVYCNSQRIGTGKKYNPGDRVTAIIDMDQLPISVSFMVNDECINVTASLDNTTDEPFFPHIYFKNCRFSVDFASTLENAPDNSLPIQAMDSLVPARRPPSSVSECQLLVMVGIVAAGKSHWVSKFIAKNPDKEHYVIGRSLLYDRWRSLAQERRLHLSERLVSKAVSKLIYLAPSRPRNYVLDQTNCLAKTRLRRMEDFKDFGVKKAILILPRLGELANRINSYRKSSEDPSCDDRNLFSDDVDALKENLALPTLDEGFDEIIYVDCDEKSAPLILDDYKYDASRHRELRSKERKSERDRRTSPYSSIAKKRFKPASPTKQRRFKPLSVLPPLPPSRSYISSRKAAMLSPPRRGSERYPLVEKSASSSYRRRGYDDDLRSSPRRRSPPPIRSKPLNKYIDDSKPFNRGNTKPIYSSYAMSNSRNKDSKPVPSESYSSGYTSSYRGNPPTSSRSYATGTHTSISHSSSYGHHDYSSYGRNLSGSRISSSGRSDDVDSYSAQRTSSSYTMGRIENSYGGGGISTSRTSSWSTAPEHRRNAPTMGQTRSSYAASPSQPYGTSSRQNYSSTGGSGPRGGVFGGYSTSGYNPHY